MRTPPARRGRIKIIIVLGGLLLLAAFAIPLRNIVQHRSAQAYPVRAVEVIVSFKAGGGTDIGARVLAGYLSNELGQPVKVRNIEGRDGEVGYARLASARADGYTIGFINLPTFLSLPMHRTTRYEVAEIEPVANYVLDPAVLVVRESEEWRSFEQWLAYSHENPYEMTVSNNGVAASNHIAASHLEEESGVQLTHVPFGGTADMLRALNDGYVDASVAKVSEVMEAVQERRKRVLATFTNERHKALPEVPALREYGFDIVLGSARALAVPSGTHPLVVEKIHGAFLRAFENPEHQSEASARQLSLHYMGGEELAQYMREQEEFLNEILPRIGL